jgi:hypothetical protein
MLATGEPFSLPPVRLLEKRAKTPLDHSEKA